MRSYSVGGSFTDPSQVTADDILTAVCDQLDSADNSLIPPGSRINYRFELQAEEPRTYNHDAQTEATAR